MRMMSVYGHVDVLGNHVQHGNGSPVVGLNSWFNPCLIMVSKPHDSDLQIVNFMGLTGDVQWFYHGFHGGFMGLITTWIPNDPTRVEDPIAPAIWPAVQQGSVGDHLGHSGQGCQEWQGWTFLGWTTPPPLETARASDFAKSGSKTLGHRKVRGFSTTKFRTSSAKPVFFVCQIGDLSDKTGRKYMYVMYNR